MLGFVIPTFGQFEFAAKAVRSAFATRGAEDIQVMIVDDASPAWEQGNRDYFDPIAEEVGHRLHRDRFCRNRGVTATWNHGLNWLIDLGCDTICVANSDVIFARNWWQGVNEALTGVKLAGPLTNAPGTHRHQFVGDYCETYTLSDQPEVIEQVQETLQRERDGQLVMGAVNGFCMTARARTWDAGRYDKDHVFCPVNTYSSTGARNPTPLMTLNEDELQRRWGQQGWQSATVLDSYVFHYRAVSRGDRYKSGDWFRPLRAA